MWGYCWGLQWLASERPLSAAVLLARTHDAAVEKSVVRAVVVTKSVTRMVVKLQAIGGGGDGKQEAGGDLYGGKSVEQEPELVEHCSMC